MNPSQPAIAEASDTEKLTSEKIKISLRSILERVVPKHQDSSDIAAEVWREVEASVESLLTDPDAIDETVSRLLKNMDSLQEKLLSADEDQRAAAYHLLVTCALSIAYMRVLDANKQRTQEATSDGPSPIQVEINQEEKDEQLSKVLNSAFFQRLSTFTRQSGQTMTLETLQGSVDALSAFAIQKLAAFLDNSRTEEDKIRITDVVEDMNTLMEDFGVVTGTASRALTMMETQATLENYVPSQPSETLVTYEIDQSAREKLFNDIFDEEKNADFLAMLKEQQARHPVQRVTDDAQT